MSESTANTYENARKLAIEVLEEIGADRPDPRIVPIAEALLAAEYTLESLTGPHCQSCANPIDPDTCWCGTGVPHYDDGHDFVPAGCDCMRYERDWKKLAVARGQLLGQALSKIRAMHDLVDLTDPVCPVGTALTKAGLAGRP
jgi:hypothetical protein